MGVVLTTAIVLGLVSAILEFRLKFIGNISRKNPKAGLAASFGLSWVLGWFFGVGGLIAFLGGLISTVVTDPVYVVQNKMAKAENPRARVAIKDVKATVGYVGKGLGLVCFGVAKLAGSPAAITRKVQAVRT